MKKKYHWDIFWRHAQCKGTFTHFVCCKTIPLTAHNILQCDHKFCIYTEENSDELFDQTKMYNKIKMLQINSRTQFITTFQETRHIDLDLQQTLTADIYHSLKFVFQNPLKGIYWKFDFFNFILEIQTNRIYYYIWCLIFDIFYATTQIHNAWYMRMKSSHFICKYFEW